MKWLCIGNYLTDAARASLIQCRNSTRAVFIDDRRLYDGRQNFIQKLYESVSEMPIDDQKNHLLTLFFFLCSLMSASKFATRSASSPRLQRSEVKTFGRLVWFAHSRMNIISCFFMSPRLPPRPLFKAHKALDQSP